MHFFAYNKTKIAKRSLFAVVVNRWASYASCTGIPRKHNVSLAPCVMSCLVGHFTSSLLLSINVQPFSVWHIGSMCFVVALDSGTLLCRSCWASGYRLHEKKAKRKARSGSWFVKLFRCHFPCQCIAGFGACFAPLPTPWGRALRHPSYLYTKGDASHRLI